MTIQTFSLSITPEEVDLLVEHDRFRKKIQEMFLLEGFSLKFKGALPYLDNGVLTIISRNDSGIIIRASEDRP